MTTFFMKSKCYSWNLGLLSTLHGRFHENVFIFEIYFYEIWHAHCRAAQDFMNKISISWIKSSQFKICLMQKRGEKGEKSVAILQEASYTSTHAVEKIWRFQSISAMHDVTFPIRGQLIFTWIGVSFENSDKGVNFSPAWGGSLTK